MNKRNVAIVHFNTPELTEAAILSLRKHGGENYDVYVFDNSDSRPFVKKMPGVTVIDNTQGQVIDLDAEILKFPHRNYYIGCPNGSHFGSAKHAMSVQMLWDILPDGFLLMDSDVLIRRNVDHMFMEHECTCGHVQSWQIATNPGRIDRLIPILLWINVPLCKAGGARFFDPKRIIGLQDGGRANRNNWYDTGASFYEDIRTLKPQCHGIRIDIRPLVVHYQAASWRQQNIIDQMAWLNKYADLWKPSPEYQLGEKTKPAANKNAKIYVCAHKKFDPIVSNPVYETVTIEGLAFFSELAHMRHVASKKGLPRIIGFCGYRKYFNFLSYVPELEPMIKKYKCIVSRRLDLEMSVRDQYDRIVGNVDDLDLATSIIDEKYKEFAPVWHKQLEGSVLHTASMFIMRTADFRKMLKVVDDIVDEYLKRIGEDIDTRINRYPQKYHLDYSSVAYQRRIGGQLCERIISAYIDWKFPTAKEMPIMEFARR